MGAGDLPDVQCKHPDTIPYKNPSKFVAKQTTGVIMYSHILILLYRYIHPKLRISYEYWP